MLQQKNLEHKSKNNQKQNLVVVKVARKEIMKKMTLIIENFSSSNSEVSLPPSKEELYIMVEATPKNDQ
jgi:hypothetical protein